MKHNGIKLNLSTLDKEIIAGTGGWPKGWLNDGIIDTCHSILKSTYPYIGGLQPCATQPQFTICCAISANPQFRYKGMEHTGSY